MKRRIAILCFIVLLGFASCIKTLYADYGFSNTVGSFTKQLDYQQKTNSSAYTSIDWTYNSANTILNIYFYEKSIDSSTTYAFVHTYSNTGSFYISTTARNGYYVRFSARQLSGGTPTLSGTWMP